MFHGPHTYDWLIRAVAESDTDSEVSAQRYSGRGMYGRSCLGFVTKSQFSGPLDVAAIFTEYVRGYLRDSKNSVEACDMLDNLTDLFANARQDSMGLGMVIYFPEIPWQPHFEAILDGEEGTSEDDGSEEEEDGGETT